MLDTFARSGEETRDGFAGEGGTDSTTASTTEFREDSRVLLAETAGLKGAPVAFGEGETGLGRCDQKGGENEGKEGCLVEHFEEKTIDTTDEPGPVFGRQMVGDLQS